MTRTALDPERLKVVYAGVASRYDWQHGLLTLWADGRGRRMLVEETVHAGDRVLDCGSGTGGTGLLAAHRTGVDGRVTLFDLSDEMLVEAATKAEQLGLSDRMSFHTGDMTRLPFDDGSFDVVLSTYSLCPLHDPADGARELYRVLRPGGRLGIAHSAEPAGGLVGWIAAGVEALAWRIPALSLGCRAVTVLPALVGSGARVIFRRRIGVPLWPFEVFVVEKPD
jgi:demethylmenaquinone methyltransferase / 2-methoxy-6-polyprenyl-1,4-benzoquinol methylase